MRQKILSLTILGVLVLVGGGCANKSSEVMPVDNDSIIVSDTEEPIPEDVDSAVAEIIKAIDDEIIGDDVDEDLSIIIDDSSAVNDFYESEYEIE